jgi:hypothetical protein
LATLAVAVLLVLLAPVDVIRCTPAHDCRIEHRIAGFYLAGTEQLSDVAKASAEDDVTSDLGGGRIRKTHVELENRSGFRISTDPMSTAVLSCGHVAASLNQFLQSPAKTDFVQWQGEAVLGVCAILLYVSYRFARAAVRALRAG